MLQYEEYRANVKLKFLYKCQITLTLQTPNAYAYYNLQIPQHLHKLM